MPKKKAASRAKKSKTQPDSILIRGGTVVTIDDAQRIEKLDLRISQGRIQTIAKKIKARPGEQVIDAKGKIVMPGLVQTHIHLCQVFTRAHADDMPLLDWLRTKVWPIEGALDEKSMRASARLGIAELLLGGTTAVVDMGTVRHTDALFTAADRMGIRYTGGKTLMDMGQGYPAGLRETTQWALDESIRLCEAWHHKSNDRLRYAFSPRFALSCTEEIIRDSVVEARKRGALLHTHASENSEEVQLVQARTGMANIEYLHSLGFSGPDALIVHCVWPTLKERKILRETSSRIVHCPSANLKLGSGIARMAELLGEGQHVSLGADGPGCNNRLDAFTEMRTAALIHKVRSGAEALPAPSVLRMATRKGAEAMGYDDVGFIAEGNRADVIVLDLNKPHALPDNGDLVSRIVYSAQSSDVTTVMVDGKVLVDDGQLQCADLPTVMRDANRSAKSVIKKIA